LNGDDVVDEFVAGGKSTYSKKDRHRCRHTHTYTEREETDRREYQSINQSDYLFQTSHTRPTEKSKIKKY